MNGYTDVHRDPPYPAAHHQRKDTPELDPAHQSNAKQPVTYKTATVAPPELSTNSLMDSKHEKEIASNLAKLKDDLKSMATAITELRNQALDNTTTTVISSKAMQTNP